MPTARNPVRSKGLDNWYTTCKDSKGLVNTVLRLAESCILPERSTNRYARCWTNAQTTFIPRDATDTCIPKERIYFLRKQTRATILRVQLAASVEAYVSVCQSPSSHSNGRSFQRLKSPVSTGTLNGVTAIQTDTAVVWDLTRIILRKVSMAEAILCVLYKRLHLYARMSPRMHVCTYICTCVHVYLQRS